MDFGRYAVVVPQTPFYPFAMIQRVKYIGRPFCSLVNRIRFPTLEGCISLNVCSLDLPEG